MKFSIITPTHQRPKELERAINSILGQDYNNFEFIIVNDSPDFDYSELENMEILKDRRIKYFKNEKNMGVNFSRNFALDNVSEDSDYIIFLDDDDWLNEKCLSEAVKIIKENPSYGWYVSNRAYSDNKPVTKNKTNRNTFNYIWDVLILKKFVGDATHIINFKKYKDLRFSKSVKLTEEWFYFFQIKEKFYYYKFNSIYQDVHTNLNLTDIYNKNKKNRIKNTFKLYKELFKIRKFNPLIWLVYLPLRVGAIILK